MSRHGPGLPRGPRSSVPAQAFDPLDAHSVTSNGSTDQLELRIDALESHIDLIETASYLFTKRRKALRHQLDLMSPFL